MSKICIVANMKGGAGKSTITMLICSWLHKTMKKKVLIIDADTLQQAIVSNRELSLTNGIKEEDLFKVMSANPLSALEMLEYVENDYDYIFIDIPGNLMEDGVIDCYAEATKFIVPMSCTLEDENATGKFLTHFSENVVPVLEEKNIKYDLKGIFFKEDKRSLEFKSFKKRMDNGEIPLDFFKSIIPYSKKLARSAGTVNPSEYINTNFDMKDLYKELETFLEV